MPLFQPSNITPSSFAGVGGGTVAVADKVKISWQVNGNVAMTAFKIDIFNMKNSLISTSGILTNNTPFYPTDRKGNPQYFLYEPNQFWSDYGLVDGEEYTLQITQWWGTDKTETSTTKVTQFSQSAFITRTKPNIAIKTASGSFDFSKIGSVFQDFTAIYTQEQGDNIDWVRWQFYQIVDEKEVLLDDTKEVNTQVLSYRADNMQSGNTYKIVCKIQTENGVQFSKEENFYVSYELPEIEGVFEFNCIEKASNLLRWGEIQKNAGDDIQGVSNDDKYSFENGELILPKNSTVTWNTKNNGELDIPTNWTLAWKAKSNGFHNKTEIIERTWETELEQTALALSSIDYDNIDYAVYAGDDLIFFITTTTEVRINVGKVLGSTILLLSSDLLNEITDKELDREIIVSSDSKYILACVGNSWKFLKYENGALETLKVITGDACAIDENNQKIITVLNGNNTFNSELRVHSFSASGYDAYKTSFYDKPISGIKIDTKNGFLVVGGYNGIELWSYTNGAITKIDFKTSSDYEKIAKGYNGVALSKNLSIVFCGLALFRYNSSGLFYAGSITSSSEVQNSVTFSRFIDAHFDNSGGMLLCARGANEENSNNKDILLQEYRVLMNNGQVLAPYKRTLISGSNTSNAKQFFSIFKNRLATGFYYIGEYSCLYSLYNKSITIGGRNIYSAELVRNPFDISHKLTWAMNAIFINGETSLPVVNMEIMVKTLKGVSTSFFETYIATNNLSISRDFNELHIGNDTIIIPEFTEEIVVCINKDKGIFYFDGNMQELDIDISQSKINSIILSGEQSCSYLYIENSTSTIANDFVPVWGDNTKFLTHFELSVLQAGQLEVAKNSMDIYRENISTGVFEKLYSCGEDTVEFRDFSWITGNKYNYYGYARLDNKYTSANVFNDSPVCRNQPYFLLIATEQDEEQPNVYHVVHYWRFGNNVSAGSVSNNNTPSFLTNFTGYRLKQPTTRDSKSGNLQALLSNTVAGRYTDNTLQMENLYALSKCNNPLFLKDMKGNLYMVTISGAITQTINTRSNIQEVIVSIPWEEIGSADGVSIIQLPTDKGWVDDNAQLEEVRLEVDEETGMLKTIYPDGYNYATTFSIEDSKLYANTRKGVSKANVELENGVVTIKE